MAPKVPAHFRGKGVWAQSQRTRRKETLLEDLHRRLWCGGVALCGEPRNPRRRRGVGVRRVAGARGRDQRERAAAHGRRRGRRPPARDDGRGRAAALRLRPRRHEGDAHRAGDPRHRARVRGRLRRHRAERDRQRGDDRRPRRARDPRHDVPGREDPRAGGRAVGREGRHDARALRRADAARRGRAPRRGVHARRDADARGRRRARPAVAQGDLQRLDEPDRRAHRAHARARLRAARPARARLRARRRGQGRRRGAGDRPRRRPGGADRPRGQAGGRLRPQGLDAAGRRGAPADGDRLSERRNRPLRTQSTASRRR